MPVPAVVLSIVFGIVLFAVVIVTIAVAVRQTKARAERERALNAYKADSLVIDGNGRTEHQRNYLTKLADKKHAQKIAQSNAHAHKGDAEHYQPIVGSLGDVKGEGCDELDGVRLLEHDESYCDDESHWANPDYGDLKQAIVLGEIINSPRFKKPFGRSPK